jgi:general stress protein 26
MNENKTKILNFIKAQKICVLSTLSPDGKPESAVIEFGETDNLEIIFDTVETYRKYKNLSNNSNVAVVIGWDKDITVQYEGKAIELVGDDAKEYKELFWKKNPKAQKWENYPGIKFFKIIPKWIKYSDLSKNPWEVFEISF